MASPPNGLVHPAVAAIAQAALARLRSANVAATPGPVTVEMQRATLATILDLGGPEDVLLAGARYQKLEQHPLFLVLVNSDSVTVLLDKIARLNRYFHSHHRHRLLASGDRSVELQHHSLIDAVPLPVESLFAAGLYLTMLEQIGCMGLRCFFPDAGSSDPAYEHEKAFLVPLTATGHWRFEWEDFAARSVLPGIDELILASPGVDLEQATMGDRVAQVVQADLARRWRVSDVAAVLLVSGRTLQRRLASEGTSLTSIVAKCRLDRARALLRENAHSITDIGYMLGYADTSHFTRAFTADMGLPPSEWRARR